MQHRVWDMVVYSYWMVSHRTVIRNLLECLSALDCKQLWVSNCGLLYLCFWVPHRVPDSKFDQNKTKQNKDKTNKKTLANIYWVLSMCHCSMYSTYYNSFYPLGTSGVYALTFPFYRWKTESSRFSSLFKNFRRETWEGGCWSRRDHYKCREGPVCRQIEALILILLLKKHLLNGLLNE